MRLDGWGHLRNANFSTILVYVLIQHFDKTDFLGDVTEEVKEQLKNLHILS